MKKSPTSWLSLFVCLSFPLGGWAQSKWDESNAAAAKAFQEERYADAETNLLAAFEEAKHFREQDPRFSFTLSQLAFFYSQQGRWADAELFYHWLQAASLGNLAELYREQSKYSEAARLHKRSLAMRERAFGREHIALAESCENLATLYNDLGKFNKAEHFYKRLIAIRTKAFGPVTCPRFLYQS